LAATNLEVWQKGLVVKIDSAAPTIRKITLRQSMPVKAEPGSHIDLILKSGKQQLRRSYSVVSQSPDFVEITIGVLKTRNSRGGSIAMHELKVGDVLDITQPIQNFPLRYSAENYILLAGGIGITALVEMGEALKRARANYRFVYVVKSRNLAIFANDLATTHGDNFQLFVDDEANELSVEHLVSSAGQGTELYMCGPIRLMDDVRREWKKHDLDITNLRYETFGAGGWFEPEPFKVHIVDRGLEVIVGENESMLDALESAGLEVMADCRKGECGLCELRVVNSKGKIEHRDVFYSEEQKHEGRKIACCVSRMVSSDDSPEISVIFG
jgi:vanillate O-demethylase ferredoxin subunit